MKTKVTRASQMKSNWQLSKILHFDLVAVVNNCFSAEKQVKCKFDDNQKIYKFLSVLD